MVPKDLEGKHILFGVTGCIAIYKALEVVSKLRKRGASVSVVMTEAATHLVAPLTFRTISDSPVYTRMFEEPRRWNVEHIALAEWGDVMVVAPATANCLAKAASGLADDYLSTLLLAFPGPKLFAPAMNTHMWQNPSTRRNVATLRDDGYTVVEPDVGRLASGAEGPGRFPEPETIVEEISSFVHADSSLAGRTVLVTAGPTREYFDPVRFLSNPSTGKMGYALASAARERGARVILISGPTDLPDPRGIQTVRVTSAQQMKTGCDEHWEGADVLIMSAAVADCRPREYSPAKGKKDRDDLLGEVVPTPDIMAELGRRKGDRLLVGFAAETEGEDALINARRKLHAKNADMMVLNIVGGEQSAFASPYNRVVVVSDSSQEELPRLHKRCLARRLMDRVVRRLPGKES
ncbi:MAG: bifunctional phosphopantothenoylcysteine decarboxylase/phosphopantothenate--cysteine ligase CoaBC [Bacillota bacterium]